MARHRDVRNLDKFLSQVFEETMLPFGGTNLVLAGGPSQLTPVPREPVFKQPADQIKDTNMNCYRLYRKLCKQGAICLSRVMRSKNSG